MQSIAYALNVLLVAVIISMIAGYFGYVELVQYMEANYIMIPKP